MQAVIDYAITNPVHIYIGAMVFVMVLILTTSLGD